MVQVDPVEPACDDGETHETHDYVDHGGPWGHGGGIICRERCRRCGLVRRTDTWATRPDNGEQGFTAVSYLREDSDGEAT